MKSHLVLSDDQFEQKFKDLSLDPKLFSHEAHLRLAFIHLKKYGLEKAVENISDQIKSFDAHHGDGTKYHHTITVAAVQIMEHFLTKTNANSFEQLITSEPRVITSFKELLSSHYSKEVLSDPRAKTEYIEPDALEF